MNYQFQEILDIGLEIEFSNIKRDTGVFQDILYKKTKGQYKSVHDASSESPEITVGNIPIQFTVNNKSNKFLSILKFKGLETLGGELNSQIMSSKNFKEHIYGLTDFLQEMGESYSTTEQDNRGSIHVHVNVSKDIKHEHLIRLLETGLATESIFYKIGGMGRINRGVKNNFAYQRPLTMPPCFLLNNKYYPIFDYNDLLKSESKMDFYNKYGDSIFQIESGNHYVTQRYTGLNFYSIPYRGSIEFRYFNKTLIPEWICAIIVLCQSFVNYALTKKFDESFEKEYRKLENNREIPEGELIYILNKFNIQEDDIITILDIWHESTMPYFNGVHQLSHLENPTFFHRDLGYKPHSVEFANDIDVVNVRKLNAEKSSILNKVKMKENDNKVNDVDFCVVGDKDININNLTATKEWYFVGMDNNNVVQAIDDFNHQIEEAFPNIEEEQEVVYEELDVETIDFYMKIGINVIDFDYDDMRQFLEDRIGEGKFIPFRFLRTDWWYELPTMFDDINLGFKVSRNTKDLYVILLSDGDETEEMHYKSVYKNQYKSFGFDFTKLLEDAHYNPEIYFDVDNNEDDENN